jgi:hypothetical protein
MHARLAGLAPIVGWTRTAIIIQKEHNPETSEALARLGMSRLKLGRIL